MSKPGGYAVANTEAEHQALTELGYGPPFEGSAEMSIEAVRAILDAAGVEYDKRLGLAKLKALIP